MMGATYGTLSPMFVGTMPGCLLIDVISGYSEFRKAVNLIIATFGCIVGACPGAVPRALTEMRYLR